MTSSQRQQQARTPERQRALDLKAAARKRIEELRADKDLSREGKVRQIADINRQLKQQLDEQRGYEKVRLDGEYEKLQRQLFSALRAPWQATPADLVAIRDAVDRATALSKPEDAARALQAAIARDDRTMIAAIGQRACDLNDHPVHGEGWAAVAREFLAQHSRGVELVEQLGEIETLTAPTNAVFDEWSWASPPEVAEGERADARAARAAEDDQPPLVGL